MNIITTTGKPSSSFPAIGTIFSTKMSISVISWQMQDAQKLAMEMRGLMPAYSARASWKIVWSTRRFLKGKMEAWRRGRMEAYHEWLKANAP